MVRDTVECVIGNIVKAYRLFEELMGIRIPRSILERVLRETEHVAIHELAHGAIRVVYPEIDALEERDHTFGECIDEVLSRLLEVYISSRMGVYVHSFEEHEYELKNYTSLSKLNIKARDLEELYRQVSRLLEERRLREAVDVVARKCKEWIRETSLRDE